VIVQFMIAVSVCCLLS